MFFIIQMKNYLVLVDTLSVDLMREFVTGVRKGKSHLYNASADFYDTL